MEQKGQENFWDNHGIFFLLFIAFFPRLTMLFATRAPFGILGWIGWLFFPYLTAAVLATIYYWEKNSILVAIAWVIAFLGTTGEYQVGRHVEQQYLNQPSQVAEQNIPNHIQNKIIGYKEGQA